MFPLDVDPGWYAEYWYGERPAAKRRAFSGSLARFAVLVVLLAGGGMVLSQLHAHGDASGYQDWEQE
jgi:hypothetical protein